MRINWLYEEAIIGDISEVLAARLLAEGKKLRFSGWTRYGQPVHIIRRRAGNA